MQHCRDPGVVSGPSSPGSDSGQDSAAAAEAPDPQAISDGSGPSRPRAGDSDTGRLQEVRR